MNSVISPIRAPRAPWWWRDMAGNAFKQLALIFGALLILALTPFLGMTFISPADIFDPANPDSTIFWRLRFPRAIAAFLAGAGLSLSGLVFQAMFRNPLATPFTLGISSGAALGASLYLRVGVAFSFLGMAGSLISALLGCLLSMILVWGITRARGGFSTSVMLLAGVIINFFFSSLVMFVQYWSNASDALQIMRWLMGSIAGVEAPRLAELLVVVCGGAWFIWRLAPELDLLTAGEELAASRGVNVRRAKMASFISASVVVGAIVSVTGPIGFVGMMVPQICRLWLGFRHSALIPASLLLGGAFLTLCDLFSRTLLAPAEVPIGIITSMFGAPFFLWTLFRGNRAGDLT